MPADLTHSVTKARKEIKPLVERIKGLIQLSVIFETADIMAKAFYGIRDGSSPCKGMEVHLAYTKAIVIDYCKPWTGNRSIALKNLDKSFLSALTESPIHTCLMELRHKMVAHIDEAFETQGVTLIGATVKNNAPMPNRLTDIYVPLASRVDVLGAPWWINDTSTILQIKTHIEKCKEITRLETSNSNYKLVDMSRKHAHVLKHMSDLISLSDLENNGQPISYPDISEGTISANTPIELSIGRQNVSSLVARYDFVPPYPKESTVENGFRISYPSNSEAEPRSFSVSFLDWHG